MRTGTQNLLSPSASNRRMGPHCDRTLTAGAKKRRATREVHSSTAAGAAWVQRALTALRPHVPRQRRMMGVVSKVVELRRHTDAEGDVLTASGVRVAVEIGRSIEGDFELLISSGAQRATQTLACLLAAMGRTVAGGVAVNPGFPSPGRGGGVGRGRAGGGQETRRVVPSRPG